MKYLLKLLCQIGLGLSTIIVTAKPFNPEWINIIIFLIVWTLLWLAYDIIHKKIVEEQ